MNYGQRCSQALKSVRTLVKGAANEIASPPKSASTSLRLLVVDGSSLQGPGAKGTNFRLHLTLDWVSMTLHEVHVTGTDQGESLNR
ncbi:MAG: hypothetical protein PHG00_14920 [Methylococcales bacterium]|nr:hypothetical protein [Methylococcales bacterium]